MSKALAQFESSAFSRIFQIHLEGVGNSDNPNIILTNLAEELKLAGACQPLLLSQNLLDQCLMEVLDDSSCLEKKGTGSKYLVECYSRLEHIRNTLQKKGGSSLAPDVVQDRLDSLNFAKGLLVSYLGLSLMSDDMFNMAQGSAQWFANSLVYPERVQGMDFDALAEGLLDDLVLKYQEDGLVNIVENIIVEINKFLVSATLSKPYTLYLKAIFRLVSKNELAVALTQANSFLPQEGWEPSQLQTRLLLGPTLSISTYPDEQNPVHQEYFLNNLGQNMEAVESNFVILRATTSRINAIVFSILDKLVRSSAPARNRCLQMFATILNLNTKRSGMRVDIKTVSSDRFMLGVQNVLLLLAQPFLTPNHNKVHSIDQDYLRNGTLLEWEQEAKLNCTPEQLEAYLNAKEVTSPNFVSHVFHLTLRALHLGLGRVINGVDDVNREVEDLKRKVEQLEAKRSSWLGQSSAPFMEQMLTRFQSRIHTLKAYLSALFCYLLDPAQIDLVIRFYNLNLVYVLKLLDPQSEFPKAEFRLPAWDGEAGLELKFGVLPDFYVIDPLNYLNFLADEDSALLKNSSLNEFVLFLTAFLSHPHLVSNPHIKIKLVEVAYKLTCSQYVAREGPLVASLLTNRLGKLHLLPSLFKFYVEVEHTGLSSQFHDKFNVRYRIHQLLKLLWDHFEYRASVEPFSKDLEFFVKFVNLLMNDTTYLLDEALAKLTEVHDLQTQLQNLPPSNPGEANVEPPEERTQLEARLHSTESITTTYVSLSNNCLQFLEFLTQALPQPFLSPEIVFRLAALLNYAIASLVGPKGGNLKVSRPEKYRFDAKKYLKSLAQVYLNLHKPLHASDPAERFVKAVAKDGRSFNMVYFDKLTHLCSKLQLVDFTEVTTIKKMFQRAEHLLKLDQEQDLDLGDVPEEFLDPIMATLMLNPVILPSSKLTVDLATIKAHLLSDNKDPFNRQPLTLDQVQENLELKEKIHQFLKMKKESK